MLANGHRAYPPAGACREAMRRERQGRGADQWRGKEVFCSTQFSVFFSALFAIYLALPWERARVWLLLVASFVFYARWNKWLAILICVSTCLDYCLALAMDRCSTPWKRLLLLSISLMANLGLLGYFKYANFFLASLYDAF